MRQTTIKENKKGQNWRTGYQVGFAEALNACGGCDKCYGKGYSTVLDYVISSSDFPDNEPIKRTTTQNPVMRFCSCGRGKQLKKILVDDVNEEMRKFKEGFAYKPKKQ